MLLPPSPSMASSHGIEKKDVQRFHDTDYNIIDFFGNILKALLLPRMLALSLNLNKLGKVEGEMLRGILMGLAVGAKRMPLHN